MAALAVVSLGATVVTSQRALSDASNVVIRGEGDLLLAAVTSELAEESTPMTAGALARVLETHRDGGLRYLAIVDRDGAAIAEAGSSAIGRPVPRPGEPRIEGRRVAVTAPIGGPRHGRPPWPPSFPGAPHPHGESAARPERPFGGLLVAELEPPILGTLERDLRRIGLVAAIASGVLLAFAIAWSRSARRLATLEEKAAREQRLVALGSMSSVMAHELRNPLASLKGHAQLLAEDLEESGDAKKLAKASRVVAEAERLERLTGTLLEFVRDSPLERIATSPADLAARSIDDLDTARVDLELDDAPPTLAIDPGRLARAIHNLVDNALQAAPEGRVTLRIAKAARSTGAAATMTTTITVRDRGPGLPPGSEAKIFEPFMTTRVRGTGLGLAVARRIAEQHGGTLTGDNHPSGGALFTLTLAGEDR